MSNQAVNVSTPHTFRWPTQPVLGLFGDHWKVQIHSDYLKTFPIETFKNYDSFTAQLGTVIKNEDRTKIIRVNIAGTANSNENSFFILKVYKYPALTRLRTWGIRSKAQREFQGLTRLMQWGIPVVEPVACGTKRSPCGMVESCFVLTRSESRTTTLRDWLKAGGPDTSEGANRLALLLQEVGSALRKLHAEQFFLFAAAAKDILVQDYGRGPLAWQFADLPYSRFLTPGFLARFGQQRDIGALSGSVVKFAGVDAFESFLSSYLDDPLGESEASLRRRILRGGEVHNHLTPMIRVRRGLRRQLKKLVK